MLCGLWVMLITGVGPGCEPSEGVDDADTEVQSDVNSPELSNEDGQTDGSPSCPAVENPGGDADKDGLPNALEDRNLNCQRESDETDPLDADTDGDGLADGDEDLNRNGLVDNGELDPRNADTDGDGVPDGVEAIALVCQPSLLITAGARPSQNAETNIALPETYSLRDVEGTRVATFENKERGSFGYVIKLEATSANVAVENGQMLYRVATAGNRPVNTFTKEFITWSTPELPGRQAIRNQLAFRYGEGSANAGTAAKDPAVLRDEIASAMSGASIRSGTQAEACDEITLYSVTIQRDPKTLLTAGLLSCANALNAEPSRRFFFEDFFNATMLAPLTYNPRGFSCEMATPPSPASSAVDVVWVIDNSGSMADEQENVARSAARFMETLEASGVDWRVAVTTTEAYSLDEVVPEVNLAHDELLDTNTGLRGRGFLSSGDGDAAERFAEYVSWDEGCERTDLVPQPPTGSNTCGSGLESGLKSGLTVLERASQSTEQAFALREDATRIVVWVSDEEDQALKDGAGLPLPEKDPMRMERVQSLVERYASLNVIGAAIVGDTGVAQGGACNELGVSGDVDGAQYGQAYIDVARATAGAFGSVCNDDLQGTIDAIIALAIGATRNVELVFPSISSTLVVAVDGQRLPRSRTQGWDFDADGNAIVLFGVSLDESSTIAIGYQRWETIVQ